jgi:hypothetical protein
VENKRLSAVLAEIKAMQDAVAAPRILTNSERIGYRKTGGKPGPKPSTTRVAGGGGDYREFRARLGGLKSGVHGL